TPAIDHEPSQEPTPCDHAACISSSSVRSFILAPTCCAKRDYHCGGPARAHPSPPVEAEKFFCRSALKQIGRIAPRIAARPGVRFARLQIEARCHAAPRCAAPRLQETEALLASRFLLRYVQVGERAFERFGREHDGL